MQTKPTAKTAKIYSIASNHSRNIESQLLTLAEQAANGEIHGLTYAISDGKGSLSVGTMGSHDTEDNDKAISALFRCAVALVMTA